MREPRFDVLFEPVQIGPVTARNRFFQVPHCNGMGYRDPTAHAHMRGIKAEGGWAVVCTEEVEIHASSEVAPFIEGRLWDDRDIPMHARLCEQVHAHGSLAGIELCYNGIAAPNRYSRISPMAPSALPVKWNDPVQARAMTKADIADVRRWHRQAVARSLEAGYDIVYVYAGHNLSIVQHFLSRRYNQRSDEYGGSIENRTRLMREVLEDTLAEAEGRAGVVCRIAVDEMIGARGLERSRDRGGAGAGRRAARLLGLHAGVVARRFGHLAVPGGGRPGALRARAEGADHEAGGRRRPVHLAGHDGADDPRRRAGHDRGGTAVDRGPVPAGQAGGGPLRGHPRVHRLQHLRVRRLHDLADPLHPEPEHGRGVAPRLAPGADPPQPERCAGAGGGRRAGRPGGGDDARPPRLRGGAGRGRRRAGRAGGARGAAAGAGRVDPGAGLPQGAAGAARQRRARLQQHARCRGGRVLRLRPRGRRDRRRLAAGRRRPLAHAPDRAGSVVAGSDTRRSDVRQAARGRARCHLRRRPLLHGRGAGRAAGLGRAEGDAGDAVGPRLGVGRSHHGTGADPGAADGRWASSC